MLFHLLARTAGNRWWRTVLGTIFLVVAGVVLAVGIYLAVTIPAELAGRPVNADGDASFGPLADLAVAFLTIAALLPPTLLAARWFQLRPPGTLSSVDGRLRWGWLWACAGVATVTTTVLLLVMLVLDDDPTGDLVAWRPFLVSTLVLLLVVPLQSAAEEYLCRGWLLQAVGSWVRSPWLPIGVQAVVFASLHGWGTPWGFADLTVFGAVCGWLAVRTGGLEAGIALHVANNLLSSFLAAAYGELTIDETAADLPWKFALVDVVMLVTYAAFVLWLHRRRATDPAIQPARPMAV
ncbi:CPBP family intramembrane glutamic endopeptidase [Actinoplanes sp. HUAS TT8]|uniref:CPBP family intramembrane glutamic endopeptidase n=1 Tax=Actinoplanes sp. HUAS TT8 TaxID=3447453 RepID=UPI003F51D24A